MILFENQELVDNYLEDINNLDIKIMDKLNDKIEFVEVIKQGATINVSYKKRRHINVV